MWEVCINYIFFLQHEEAGTRHKMTTATNNTIALTHRFSKWGPNPLAGYHLQIHINMY